MIIFLILFTFSFTPYEGAVLVFQDARTPRSIALEKIKKFPSSPLGYSGIKEYLEKNNIFSDLSIPDSLALYSLSYSEDKIAFLKKKTGKKYLLFVQLLQYGEKSSKMYRIKYKYQLINMEDKSVIAGDKFNKLFREEDFRQALLLLKNSILNKTQNNNEKFLINNYKPIFIKKVKKYLEINEINQRSLMSMMLFPSAFLLSPSSPSQQKANNIDRIKGSIISVPFLFLSTEGQDIVKGNFTLTGLTFGFSAGCISGVNITFWFPGLFYSQTGDPLESALKNLLAVSSTTFLSAGVGAVVGKSYKLDREKNDIPYSREIIGSSTLGMICLGDSEWGPGAEGIIYFPRNGYFITLSSNFGIYRDGDISPFMGIGSGIGWKSKKIPLRIIQQIFFSTPYKYSSYGFLETEINLKLPGPKIFNLSPFIRKRIPLSPKIIQKFNLKDDIELGVGLEIHSP